MAHPTDAPPHRPLEASRIRPGRIALQLRPHLIPENRVAHYPSEEVAFVARKANCAKGEGVSLSGAR